MVIKNKIETVMSSVRQPSPVAVASLLADRAQAGREERAPIEHVLKSWPHLFEPALRGVKTHDVRRIDRDFRIGDTLLLREFDPGTGLYSGREIAMKITYITSADSPCAFYDPALADGFCILSVTRL